MSEQKFKDLGGGLVKKKERRVVGLFIDGVNLDRATRRLNKKVDLQALVRGVCSGSTPVVARYYTVIPHEDDSRHRAFLDAVARAGLSVIVKRLPPKGIERQVTTDLEMAADIVAFSLGLSSFSKENEYLPAGFEEAKSFAEASGANLHGSTIPTIDPDSLKPQQRGTGPLGADTTNADFSQFNSGDILKSAAKWIDLSGSETIWRE